MAERTQAYRTQVDLSVAGQCADAGGLLHLPVGIEDDDQRVSLLVATSVLERAAEHDEPTPTRRSRK